MLGVFAAYLQKPRESATHHLMALTGPDGAYFAGKERQEAKGKRVASVMRAQSHQWPKQDPRRWAAAAAASRAIFGGLEAATSIRLLGGSRGPLMRSGGRAVSIINGSEHPLLIRGVEQMMCTADGAFGGPGHICLR